MRRLLTVAWVLLAGCSAREGGIRITVTFAPGLRAPACVRLVRSGAGVTPNTSEPVPVRGKASVVIGLAQGKLPNTITLQAVGFADEACTLAPAVPASSDATSATFRQSPYAELTLEVKARAEGSDRDGDGSPDSVDCAPDDPMVRPGLAEVCGNGVDDNCDSRSDCADSLCTGAACGAGASCANLACVETDCGDALDNNGLRGADCLDSDCAGKACTNGGTCVALGCAGAQSEVGLCSDGLDNDGDLAIDCADSDCAAQPCASADLCVVGATCSAGSCQGGTARTCAPPGACFEAGVCQPQDGGCRYAPAPGRACSDGNLCTQLDVCSDAGTCTGTTRLPCLSPPPGPCFRDAGTCDPLLGCQYPAAVGRSCDDGQDCTLGERCAADATCAGGAQVSCAPNACQSPLGGSCLSDGGCRFDPLLLGTACDGGACNGAGACLPGFPYVPSTFDPLRLPAPPPTDVQLGCGVTVVGTAGAAPSFTNWCAGQPQPAFQLVAQDGGPEVMVLSFGRLAVLSGSTLRFEGDRPAVIAAFGDVEIGGTVLSAAGSQACASGGVGGNGDGQGALYAGGAGGAGFGAVGGAGAEGLAGASGGAPGATNGEATLQPLRGGCPGGVGGRSGRRAAAGGGALQISSAANLIISGSVAAPGAGGAGNGVLTGGNGAGSGGALLLEGRFLTLTTGAALTCNGGGGGEGGGVVSTGEDGMPGRIASLVPADGGSSFRAGGAGGDGASAFSAARSGATGLANGGGGGGAVGRIRLNLTQGCDFGPGALRSPRPTSNLTDGGCL